ncbi:hypothetical protein D9M68_404090 [compost metagenome]
MATANVPSAFTQHAAALARILQVTQQAWGLGQQGNQASACAAARGAAPRLARAAARAFEAQVMAIRCRQVFVG